VSGATGAVLSPVITCELLLLPQVMVPALIVAFKRLPVGIADAVPDQLSRNVPLIAIVPLVTGAESAITLVASL
jgi:hypothetical protein